MRTHRGRTDLEEKSSDDNQAKHICKFTYKYASEDCFFGGSALPSACYAPKIFYLCTEKKHERGNGDALCTHKRDCALHDVLCCDFVATRAEQSSHLH